MEFLVPSLLGLLIGLLLGLTGAGGGLLAAPLLMVVMHLTVAQAAPISLIAVSLGAGLGMLMGLTQGTVRYRAALVIAMAGLVASPVGVHLARLLPNTLLTLFFIALLIFQARRLWLDPAADAGESQACEVSPNTGRFVWNRPCARALAGAGLMAGFLSGLLGVGGGFILVPALKRHTPLTMHSITATSLMVLTLLSLGGLAQWLAHGEIQGSIALPFTCGMVGGMVGGRLLAPRVPEQFLRRGFAFFCVATALALIAKGAMTLVAGA